MTSNPKELANLLNQTRSAPLVEQELGVVVGGSISKGLVVRLNHHTSPESLAVGRYVVVQGDLKRYFCMISDITLESTNPGIQADPPDITDDFLKQVYSGTMAYGKATVTPMLVIDENDQIGPVKSIPSHFTKVTTATQQDVSRVFGEESSTNFFVGSPLELLETQINLDLKRLIERSIGVFGKSGTGKSFLTRLVLAGIIHRGVGQTLIFDMHNDYGWQATSEGAASVKGLKQLFMDKVAVLTLDNDSAVKRNAKIDYVVQIGYHEIEPEDIALLKNAMGFTDTMVDAANTLARLWGKNWVQRALNASAEDVEMISEKTNIHTGTFDGLQRRLQRFLKWHFLSEAVVENSAERILHTIVDEQRSVVLEFGRYGNELGAYMFVANFLTRRIHNAYVDKIEKALGDGSPKPPNLVITIEEAHKFLEPQVARQTTFGVIARELRKYNVTLLVVDQRPSAIDDEVMSQIGTRITALLDNERDIAAVLNGVSGAASLREVLARLETKQQAIIMGHAVPMPVVIKPRTYDEAFYSSLVDARPRAANPVAALSGRPRAQL
ncbi:ATP-binding protein [Aggregatilineales bacterium SYSU G02658]